MLVLQIQDIPFPTLLKRNHVVLAQYLLQTLVAGAIFLLMTVKFLIELNQNSLLLKIVAKIPSLRIVGAPAIIIECINVHRRKLFEG